MTEKKKGCYWCGRFKQCDHISVSVKKLLRDNSEGMREIWGRLCSQFAPTSYKKEEVQFT
jgi:hypothetical protein